MDPEIIEFARSNQAFQEAMTRAAGSGGRVLTPVGEQVQEFRRPAGRGRADLRVVSAPPDHHVDLALQALLAE